MQGVPRGTLVCLGSDVDVCYILAHFLDASLLSSLDLPTIEYIVLLFAQFTSQFLCELLLDLQFQGLDLEDRFELLLFLCC